MNHPGGPFAIHISAAVLSQLRHVQRRAALLGWGDEMVAALRVLGQNLESRADDFGEPTYRLPNLRLQIRVVVIPPVIVHFGISEDRPDVYIKWVELLGE